MLQLCGRRHVGVERAVPVILQGRRWASAEAASEVDSFAALGANDAVVAALRGVGILRPTAIQALALPKLLARRKPPPASLISAQTGTGKTLAFLLPMLQRLKERELAWGPDAAARKPGRPRAVVVVPNRELAVQTLAAAKVLTKELRLSAALLVGGGKQSPQTRMLAERPLDLLVATPARLLMHRDQDRVYFTKLEYLVVDEADTMLDTKTGFSEEVQRLLDPVKGLREHHGLDVELLLASATVTEPLVETLKRTFGGYEVLSTKDVNKAFAIKCKHEFLHLQKHNGEDKMKQLSLLIAESNAKQLLVFCNSAESARATEHSLRERGVTTACLHGEIPPKLRQENWEKFSSGASRVLVCTDIAARGLDTLSVEHVIMLDFALDGVTYIHRAGRTARAGRKGRVTSLVNRREKPLATVVEHLVKNGAPLEKWNRSNSIKEIGRAHV